MKSAKTFVLCLLVIGALMAVPLAHAQVSIAEDGVAFPDATLQTTAFRAYEIGDTGPAGGFVFYVTADGLHGLEAAPVDQSADARWGCRHTDLLRADGTGIGAGARNTQDILYGCTTAGIAAELAADYVSPSGHQDWYLPSKDELNLMHDNLHDQDPRMGNLDPNGGYWSSSENDFSFAWYQNFSSGVQLANPKFTTSRVRAVRVF